MLLEYIDRIVEFFDRLLGERSEKDAKILQKMVICDESDLSYENTEVSHSFAKGKKTRYVLNILMGGKEWEVGINGVIFDKVKEGQRIKIIYHLGRFSKEIYPKKMMFQN